jgi:hypothetical protein
LAGRALLEAGSAEGVSERASPIKKEEEKMQLKEGKIKEGR